MVSSSVSMGYGNTSLGLKTFIDIFPSSSKNSRSQSPLSLCTLE